jgi:hypothetical protein
MAVDQKDKALATIDGEFRVVRPLISANEAVQRWTEYQELVRKIVEESDIQSFTEDGKTRSFIKKSGWAKLATYYGISLVMVDERLFHRHDGKTCLRAQLPDKFGAVVDCGCAVVGARYVVRATAPNGRSVEAIGIATFNEKRARYTRVEHDLAGKAYTRAVNRAISSMIGAGEVSAEEKADEVEAAPAAGESLSPTQLAKYEGLWKDAAPDRRDRARALLEAEGYTPGEFRKRGGEHFDQVIALLEGRDEIP